MALCGLKPLYYELKMVCALKLIRKPYRHRWEDCWEVVCEGATRCKEGVVPLSLVGWGYHDIVGC